MRGGYICEQDVELTLSGEWAGRSTSVMNISHGECVRKLEGPGKEGTAEHGKGGLKWPEKNDNSFKYGGWLSLLEKVRFELRLEGGQGVRLALSRGRLSPAVRINEAGVP